MELLLGYETALRNARGGADDDKQGRHSGAFTPRYKLGRVQVSSVGATLRLLERNVSVALTPSLMQDRPDMSFKRPVNQEILGTFWEML